METQSAIRGCILLTLVVLVALQGTSLYLVHQERMQRQAVTNEVLKSIAEIEKQRVEVFVEYVKDLNSFETRSVYHQIYHASNAQLKLNNLAVQEAELLAALIAGKK